MKTKIDTIKIDSPILYICFDCGNGAKERKYPIPESCGTTVHTGECDSCKQRKGICHVRHFGYPVFEVDE